MAEKLEQRLQIDRVEAEKMLQGRKIIGFTGYSKPPRESAYMEKVAHLVQQTLDLFVARGPEKYGVVYGCSDTGLDRVLEMQWQKYRQYGIPLVGITCHEFLEWVPDEENRPPLLVCGEKEQYFRLFREFLDVMICTGGREHAWHYDLQAIAAGKTFIVCNCAPEIPGLSAGKINNVAALLQDNLRFSSPQDFSQGLVNWIE